MGGCLILTPVLTNSRGEHEESYEKFDTSAEDEDPNNCWYYRPSSFHELKALALRAGIQHLESIQQQVDERMGTDSSPRPASPTDEKALEDASAVIPPAVRLLRSWLRERVLDESGFAEMPFMNVLRMGVPRGNVHTALAAGLGAQARGPVALENMLNTNFLFSEVAKHESCPPQLHRVGLDGLFFFTKMPDNNQFIYPFEARVVGGALTRVFEFLPDSFGMKEFAGGLKDML
ncbi:hypothetical protein V8D89_008021 [Ganoderma adspersum]